MRLSHILIKDGYLEINSAVHFSELTDTCVIKSADGCQRVRMGRLLKTDRPLAESYCFKDLAACVEMITSDQVQENEFATIWVLERTTLCGRQFFNVHSLSHGLESGNFDNENRCTNFERLPWDSSHCTLVLVHTHPSLLIDYDDCAFELAQSFKFFLNDAYVYQIFYPRRASEWRIGRYHEICSFVRSDYRQAYFPHLMRACSFMSEGEAFFQSSLDYS